MWVAKKGTDILIQISNCNCIERDGNKIKLWWNIKQNPSEINFDSDIEADSAFEVIMSLIEKKHGEITDL